MTSARVELLAAKLQRMEQLVAFDFAEEITDFTVVELLELSARMDLIFPVVKLGYRRPARERTLDEAGPRAYYCTVTAACSTLR